MGNGNNTDHYNEVMNSEISNKTNVAGQEETINKLNLRSHTAYIDADPYIANPYALLGMVLQIRKINGICPRDLADPNYSFEFTPIPIARKVDSMSKLSSPKLRGSIIVDENLAVNVSFLSYLNAELSSENYFSLMIFDQAAGIIDQHDQDWPSNVRQWKQDNTSLMNDPDICYLFAISGFVQKNIIRKKYTKFKKGIKGGAYGLNVGGQLATSTDEYSLDIKFGINPIVLKRPSQIDPQDSALITTPTVAENNLFAGLTGSTFQSTTLISK